MQTSCCPFFLILITYFKNDGMELAEKLTMKERDKNVTVEIRRRKRPAMQYADAHVDRMSSHRKSLKQNIYA